MPMMVGRLALMLTVVLSFFCSYNRAASEIRPVAASASSPDPLLLHGTLPNGFRYVLLPRPDRSNRISLRLVVHAGSLDEHDDELGYAHFVEHMAFNGTRHYPPGKLVPFFQRLGLAWGADANAETSFTSTIYKLDLPANHASHLEEALRVLRDYADGIEFDPSEVHRERAVVLSELGARDTNEWQMRMQQISAYYAGTGLPEHLPIGNPERIRHAEPAALRQFYQRCYQPDRMTLVIVGDAETESLLKLLQKNFAGIRHDDQSVNQVLPAATATRGLQAHVIRDPLSTAASVSLTAIMPAGEDRRETIEVSFGNAVIMAILDQRLKARRTENAAQIGDAGVVLINGLDGRFIHYGLGAESVQANWAIALGVVETELRRARETGFSPAEISEARAVILAKLRSDAAGFSGENCDALANEIALRVAARRDWQSPAAQLAIAENYLAGFTPATAAECLRAALPADQLHLVLSCSALPVGGADALLAAYHASTAQPLAEVATHESELKFLYEDFGSPGPIAQHTQETKLGLDKVRFGNGVRVNLRSSTSEPHRFRLSARLGHGISDVPRDRPGMTVLAAALMSRCDLGRHSRDEIRRLINARAVEGSWRFENGDFFIQLTGPSESLPFALKALTSSLADLKLESAKMSEAHSVYPALASSILNSTSGFTKVETVFRATAEDPRVRIPWASEVQPYSFDEVANWLRVHWLEGPLEIGLAGDFNVDSAIASAAASVGTLSPRREIPAAPGDRFTFLTKLYRNLTLIDLPDKTASVCLFWPIKPAPDLRTSRALQIATAALENRLRLKLRQELGVTYSPSGAIYHASGQSDFQFATMELTFPPDKAAGLAETGFALADEMGRRGLTKDEFASAREPLRTRAREELHSNEWWLANVLIRAQSQPEVLEEARTHETAFDNITRDEVNRAAARLFVSANSNCAGFIPRVEAAPKAESAPHAAPQ